MAKSESSAVKQQKICDGLIEMGAPLEVAEYAASRNPSSFLYTVLNFGYVAIMISGFVVGAFFWNVLENIAETNARAAALEADALLYSSFFGISMIIALFGWIFASGILAYIFTGPFENARLAIFTFSSLDAKSRMLMKLERFTQKHGPFSSPKEYIDRWWQVSTRVLIVPSLVLLGLAAATLDREFDTYSLVTEEAIVVKPILPFEVMKRLYWKDVETVEVGCNFVKDDNAHSLVYKVRFRNGDTHRLDSLIPVEGSWLDAIEVIDAAIVDNGGSFSRWEWLDRNPMDPQCLAGFQQELSTPDYQRLQGILRSDGFE